jgi:hypothetical protein
VGFPPAQRAAGSRTAASFLSARVARVIRIVHGARQLNFDPENLCSDYETKNNQNHYSRLT